MTDEREHPVGEPSDLHVVVASCRSLLVGAIELALRNRTEVASFTHVTSDDEMCSIPNEPTLDAVLVDLDHLCVTSAGLDRFRSQSSPCRTIGFYDLFTSQHASRAFELGLTALVPTTADEQAFSDAIVDASEQVGVTRVSGVGNDDRRRLASLTHREIQVLVHIAGGSQRQETATSLGIAVSTVDGHRRHILKKLGLESQAMAVALAQRAGYLDGT